MVHWLLESCCLGKERIYFLITRKWLPGTLRKVKRIVYNNEHCLLTISLFNTNIKANSYVLIISVVQKSAEPFKYMYRYVSQKQVKKAVKLDIISTCKGINSSFILKPSSAPRTFFQSSTIWQRLWPVLAHAQKTNGRLCPDGS